MKFTDLDLHPTVMEGIKKVGFSDCTPIQEKAIPLLLEGRDIAGLAQTGTGKTAAFLLPLIDRVIRAKERAAKETETFDRGEERLEQKAQSVDEESETADSSAPDSEADSNSTSGEEVPSWSNKEYFRVFPEWKHRNFVLILVPTRELAEQVYDNAVPFMEPAGLKGVSVYGGTSYDKQKSAFKEGVEFVIATPGRLIDLFKEHIVDLKQVRAVIFDEADRMFDMGFKDDMKYILRRVPRERQFLVFSATLNFDVLNVAYEFGAEPVEINISKDQPKAENVVDELFHVGQDEKPSHLLSLLKKHAPQQTIIFSNFKRNVERLALFLNQNGHPAMGISSLLTQGQRNRVMAQFKSSNDSNILVATDLAARGLDILGVDLVINYELPDDPENYVHRIGRTGRAGHKGLAFSLVSDRDVDALNRIEQYLGHKVATGWMEDTDLIKEFEAFPREVPSDFRQKGKSSRRDGERSGQRKPRRSGSGPRPQRARGGDRPTDERDLKVANGQDASTSGGSGKRRRRRRRRPEGAEASQQQHSQRQSHRDRAMGRHRGDDSAAASSTRSPSQSPRRREAAGGNGSQQKRRRRPQRQRTDQRRRPEATPPPPASVAQKVSGFFKKLFGG